MRVHYRVPPWSYREQRWGRSSHGRTARAAVTRVLWLEALSDWGGEITAFFLAKVKEPPLTFDAGAGKRLVRWKRFRDHLPVSPTSQRGRVSGSPPSRAWSTTAETSPHRPGSGCSRRSALWNIARARSPKTSRSSARL